MSKKHIGQRIADLREDHDMQQGELADILGIHRSVLSRIEKGHRPIREDELLRIARYFHVSIDDLLNNEPLPQTSTETYCTHREKELLRKYRAISRENKNLLDALLDSFYRSNSTDGEKPQNR